jgi:hypothetical protein
MRFACPDKLALPYFGALIMEEFLQNTYFPNAYVSRFPLTTNVLYYTPYNKASVEVPKE